MRSELHNMRRATRSEEHTSELQSPGDLVCRLLLEKKKKQTGTTECTLLPPEEPALPCTRCTRGSRPLSAATRRSALMVIRISVPLPFFFLITGPPPDFSPFPYPRPSLT